MEELVDQRYQRFRKYQKIFEDQDILVLIF